jgi:hypothetical protein
MVSTLSQGVTNRRRLPNVKVARIYPSSLVPRERRKQIRSLEGRSSIAGYCQSRPHPFQPVCPPRERSGRHALSGGDSISTGYCQGRPCLSRSNRPPREKDGRRALSKDTPFLLSYCRSRPGLPQPICPRRKDEFVNWVAHLTCALPKMSSARMIGAKPR